MLLHCFLRSVKGSCVGSGAAETPSSTSASPYCWPVRAVSRPRPCFLDWTNFEGLLFTREHSGAQSPLWGLSVLPVPAEAAGAQLAFCPPRLPQGPLEKLRAVHEKDASSRCPSSTLCWPRPASASPACVTCLQSPESEPGRRHLPEFLPVLAQWGLF